MYHDQGLAPFKALSFGNGVNFTAGLNKIRTSPDHGTAYEIAGKGMANHNSFKQALYTALDIFKSRKEHNELIQNKLEPRKWKIYIKLVIILYLCALKLMGRDEKENVCNTF